MSFPSVNNLPCLLTEGRWSRADAVALSDGRSSVSYAQLDDWAWQIAARLHELGVVTGDRVAVSMPKSVAAVASLLGAMRAGAAYVPIDCSAPADRNRFIARDCAVRVACVDEPRASVFQYESGPALLVLPGDASAADADTQLAVDWLRRQPISPAIPQPAPDDLAYILYTSGSTGKPKGVMHSHRSALSFVRWAAELLRPTSRDRFSSHAPFHFDLSILDLYVPLAAGASIVLVGESLGKDPRRLAPFIAEQRITSWYSVPSILALLAQFGDLPAHDFSQLRTVLFAGEIFPIQQLRLLKQFWPRPRFVNLYGPTETNVCTYYPIPDHIDETRDNPYPIGRPCENVRSLIVDDSDFPVPDREEGQLLVHQSGPTMLGYWNLPDQTERAFFLDASGDRWYRTGDVVREDDHGDYEFLGRRDRMVKRHGYRIELGEIESALYRHADIREAAVVAEGRPDGVMIRAYLSTKSGNNLSIIALKQFCGLNLPGYMIPDQFQFLAELPRTSTDKIDYQNLKCDIRTTASA